MGLTLKDRKKIKNGLPEFKEGATNVTTNDAGTASSKWGDAAASIPGAIQGLASFGQAAHAANQVSTTSNDYLNKYGTTQMHVGDIGYTKYNDINRNAELSQVSRENTANTINTTVTGLSAGLSTGASIGMMIGSGAGPIGAAIGAGVGAIGGLVTGLISGGSRRSKAERELAEAQDRANRLSDMNRSSALTQSLQQDQALKYGNQENQTLFSYHGGKAALDTSDGMLYGNTAQNAWVEKGEVMHNKDTKNSHIVRRGPNDSAPARVKSNDYIFPKYVNPFTENNFNDDAAPFAAINEFIQKNRPKTNDQHTKDVYDKVTAATRQKAVAALDNLGDQLKYTFAIQGRTSQNENMPRFADGYAGWVPNAISGLAGTGVGLYQYLQAANDEPYNPETYVANPYQARGLNTLAGLRINPYNITQQLRNAEARTAYAVNASGGLNTAQKQLFRQSGLATTQQNIANMLQQVQAQNNQYRAAYADAALRYGESEAQRRQQANQYGLDYYTKAHAARQQGMQMGVRNMLDTLNQTTANEFKRQQFNYMLDLYRDRNKLDWEKFNGSYGKNLTWLPGASATNPIPALPASKLAPQFSFKIPNTLPNILGRK